MKFLSRIKWTLFLSLALAGCRTAPHTGPAHAAGEIDELHMLSMPVAMNLDAEPGADGCAVKIYALTRGNPKPVQIRDGQLEVLLFDGASSNPMAETNKALRTWNFPARQLAPHRFQTTIGTGYALSLGWGDDRPKKPRVTVLARYLAPSGRTVYSAPNSISVAAH